MVPLGLAWKPVSIPPSRRWQGVLNGDWVTVWFFGKKTNLQDNIRKKYTTIFTLKRT